MAAKVRLSDVVGELELASDMHTSHINRVTGEIVMISDEDARVFDEAEDDSEVSEDDQETYAEVAAVLGSDDWLQLPRAFDIHEYEIMASFARSHPNASVSDELCDAIVGRGAFRRFKDAAHRLGVIDEWYAYKTRALEEIAREWLVEHEFEIDETPRPLPGKAAPPRGR